MSRLLRKSTTKGSRSFLANGQMVVRIGGGSFEAEMHKENAEGGLGLI
jgi:hypothetical protein